MLLLPAGFPLSTPSLMKGKCRTAVQWWEKQERGKIQSEAVVLPVLCIKQHLFSHSNSSNAPHHELLHATPLTRIGMFAMFLHSHFTQETFVLLVSKQRMKNQTKVSKIHTTAHLYK